jgi:perosamine synthetase
MSILRTAWRTGRSLAKLAPSLLSPAASRNTSLTCMTLDFDDVQVVKTWLRNRRQWNDAQTVPAFATEFARWNGSEFACAFRSCREALSACVDALKLHPGDEVILPGYTCVAVPNVFHFSGIQTVYSDIELDTFGLDASKVASKITPRTRAILFQHLYGLVSRDTSNIAALARQHGLWLIEDCAHATGAEYKGRKVGNFGDVAVFSSEQSKVFNTNQGGLAATNNREIAERLREVWRRSAEPVAEFTEDQLYNILLNFEQWKHPQRRWRSELAEIRFGSRRVVSTTPHEMQGIRPPDYGRRMSPPIAALGLNQLRKVDRYNEQRRRQAQRWDDWCGRHGYAAPVVLKDSTPVFLRYPVLVEPERKKDPSWAKRELGIELGVWFVSHIHPADWPVANCPRATEAVQRCVNFPSLII